MSRPRVLLAVTSPLTLILMRGQVSYLRRAGFEVSVVSAPGAQLEHLAREEGAEPVPVALHREISVLSDLTALWRIYRLLCRLRPQVVNAGTPKAGLLFGIASWLARVPCRVHTLRGLRSETAQGLKRRLLLLAEWLSCRSAHRVVCVSRSLRDRAIALGLTDARRSFVFGQGSSNGVEGSRFAPTEILLRRAADLRRELGIPTDAPVIGFVGRLTRDKGVAELVAAFARLRVHHPELRLLLIGEREAGDPLPPETTSALGHDPQIVCTGSVRDPSAYYHVMTLFALPTYREGFPNVVLEAQAAGLPVVTTSAAGAVDSIVDGSTGLLVPPGEVEALAAALDRLLRDPNLAARMGAAGRDRVARDFSPENIWECWVALYRELLAERSPTVPARAAASGR